MSQQLGQGRNAYTLDVAVADTAVHISKPTHLGHARGIGYQLVTEGTARRFVGGGADAVVASTHTWTLANGVFATTDVGGKFIVQQSVLNNGSMGAGYGQDGGLGILQYNVYNITARTSATVIVTDGTQTDETFTTATTFIVVPPGTLDGAWTIEVSNNYSPEGGTFGQAPTEGTETWTDITTAFSPTIAAVDHTSSATRNQFVQAAPMAGRVLRCTFKATTGSGKVKVLVGGGSY